MISVSEDGTIAVTNLNSSEMHKLVHNFSINEQQRKRADQFMGDRNDNRGTKRRHSISQHFTMNQYLQLVKVKSQKVYSHTMTGQIEKILEVKNIVQLQQKLHVLPEM